MPLSIPFFHDFLSFLKSPVFQGYKNRGRKSNFTPTKIIMLKIAFIGIAILIYSGGFAQPGKKPTQKNMPPTQKEIQDMMKEMQKELDGMSAEDKKMLDSMGVKLPSMKNIPNVSDKQLAGAWKGENQIVPKRDAARIASVPKAVTDSKMGAYIIAIQSKLGSVLKPAVITAGNEMYEYIKSNSKTIDEAGNMAIGLWLAGQPEVASYVLGKLCVTDAANTDNLNNYSAMLSMQGAQHLAIPILNNLNAKYPKNSTLLNNLGQAWFGLGEIGKAEKYLDSAIRIYAYHPQANLTKSFIEESKGNKQEAINAVKRSIVKAYSVEKETRLNKLGYMLTSENVSWDRPMPQDPLGLEKFKWPAYPMNVAESEILEAEWDAFKEKCREEIDGLKTQEESLQRSAEESNSERTKNLMQAGQKGSIVSPIPLLAYKAMAKLNNLIDDKDGHMSFSYQKKTQSVLNAHAEAEKLEDILSNQLKTVQENYKDKFGEGKSNPFDAACADDTKAKNGFLSSSNALMQDAFNDYLGFMRRKITNETYYNQYTMWPENFELAKVQAKIAWLSLISGQHPKFKNKSSWCQNHTDAETKPFRLANFDDIACQYKSSLNLGCVKMETNCGQTTTTYGCGPISFVERELGQNYIGGTLKLSPKAKIGANTGPLSVEGYIGANINIELDENNHVKDWDGKITAGIEGGIGINKGPVKLGATIGESVEVEFGSTGISDINIVSTGKIEAGIEAPKSNGDQKIDEQINKGIGYVNKGIGKLDTNIEVGIESRMSLISGHGSFNGIGILEGIKIIGW